MVQDICYWRSSTLENLLPNQKSECGWQINILILFFYAFPREVVIVLSKKKREAVIVHGTQKKKKKQEQILISLTEPNEVSPIRRTWQLSNKSQNI